MTHRTFPFTKHGFAKRLFAAVSFLFFLSNSLFSQIDVRPLILESPTSSLICYDLNTPLIVKVENSGTEEIDFSATPLTVTVTVSGPKSGVFRKTVASGLFSPPQYVTINTWDTSFFALDVAGTYIFEIKTSLADDTDSTNNEIAFICLIAPPVSVPFFENCTSSISMDNFTYNDVYPNCSYTELLTAGENTFIYSSHYTCPYSSFTLPQIGTIRQGDVFSFDYKALLHYQVGFGSPLTSPTNRFDYILVQASTDCGRTFEDIHRITAAEHTATDVFVKTTIPLSNFVGQDLKIRFITKVFEPISASWVHFEFDNFSINTGIPTDIGAINVENLAFACDNPNQSLKVRIKNFGRQTINFATTPTTVTAKITGRTTATLTKNLTSGTLTPEGVLDIRLDGFFNMSALNGNYNVTLYTALPNDAIRQNDTMRRVLKSPIEASSIGLSLPLLERFDSTATPRNWVSGPNSWNISRNTGIGGSNNVYNFVNDNTPLVSPRIAAIRATDRFSFDIKLTNSNAPNDPTPRNWGKCFVEVSNDCGATYEKILTINSRTLKTGVWTNLAGPLSNFVGQNILIRIRTEGNPETNYRVDIDNFTVSSSPTLDMGVIDLANPATHCPNPNQSIAVKVRNFSNTAINFVNNPATINAVVSAPFANTLSKIINTGSLASGDSLTVLLTSSFNMQTAGNYTIKTSVSTPNDNYPSNDTISAFIPVRTVYNLPFNENFDSTSSTYPLGWVNDYWTVSSGLEYAKGKYFTTSMLGQGTKTAYLPILKTVGSDDYLIFRYNARITDLVEKGSVIFEASTDCGQTYQPIWTERIGSYYTYRYAWDEARIPLSIFSGNPIDIRVKVVSTSTQYWHFALDDIRIGPVKPIDIACDTVYTERVAPPECGTSAQSVHVQISNKGSKAIDFSRNPTTIKVNLSGAGTQTLAKTINRGILPVLGKLDTLLDVAFNTVDSGYYNLKAIATTVGDVISKNDTSKRFNFHIKPPFDSVPYRQNFDTLYAPGWAIGAWTLSDTGGVQNSAHPYIQISIGGLPLTSPKIGKIKAGDRLYFDYHIDAPQLNNWGYFKVLVSTNCGYDYTEILTVMDSSYTPSFDWQTKSISLDTFKGNNILVQIVPYGRGTEFIMRVDNFGIEKAPAVDVALSSFIVPKDGCGSSQQSLTLAAHNWGNRTINFAQTPLVVKAFITGRTTKTLTKTLNTGVFGVDSTIKITFDSTVNTSNAGIYNYKIVAQIANDGNRTNDTLGTFTNRVAQIYTLPLSQNFDSIDIHPISNWETSDWTLRRFDSTSAGKCLNTRVLYYNSKTLILPKLGLIRAGEALDFDYRFTNFPLLSVSQVFKIGIEIKEECDTDFQEISYELFSTGQPDDVWYHVNFPLNNYVGKNITIRLRAIGFSSARDFDAALDNIEVNNYRRKDVEASSFENFDTPFTCYQSRSTWRAGITNSGQEVIDFAVNPMTITAVFTGVNPSRLLQRIDSGTLAIGEEFVALFDVDMSRAGLYRPKLIAIMAGDVNLLNDTLAIDSVDTRGIILPYSENFENRNASSHFSASDFVDIEWEYGRDSSVGIRKDLNGGKSRGYIELPRVGIVRTGDSLAFDYRVTSPVGLNWGQIKVQVSTNCDSTFTDIYTINQSNYTPSVWAQFNQDIGVFAGKSIIVRLAISYLPGSSSGNFFAYFDNFRIRTPSLSTTPPVNDSCNAAISLKQYPNGHLGTTVAATVSLPQPTCSFIPVKDVWYKIVDPTDVPRLAGVSVILDNIQGGANAIYSVYKGNCTTMLELDSLCGVTTTNATITLNNLEQGQTYFLRLWSSPAAQVGTYRVRLANAFPMDSLRAANPNTPTCRPLSIIEIRQDNNNVWVPVMDGTAIVAELKANGNNLGQVKTDYFIHKSDSIRRVSTVPYLNRNVGFRLDTQPRTPVSVRIYITAAEWQALRNADPSVTDTTFSLTRVSYQTCTNSFVAVATAQITGATLNPFNGGYFIQFSTTQFSQFFIHNKKAVLNTSTAEFDVNNEKVIAYPIPTEGSLTIEIETADLKDTQLKLVDMMGKVLMNQTVKTENIGLNHYQIDLTDLQSGYYFLVVTRDGRRKTIKVIR